MFVLHGVFCAVLFTSVALWAQEPQANSFTFSASITDADNEVRKSAEVETLRLRPEGELPHFKLDPPLLSAESESDSAQAPSTRSGPKAVAYSPGYETRAKIHKYASYATLPLFIGEAIVGQKLLDESSTDSDSSLKGTHSALAAGIGVLFGVNTVTGIWNMRETRNAPGARNRLIHGVLMLAADVGLVATIATAPHRDRVTGVIAGGASTHKGLAYTFFGIGTVGYIYGLVMR